MAMEMEEFFEASNQPQGCGGNSEQFLSRLSSQLRPYLDAADALKADKSSSAVNYPSIVVIGDQSEGKSTVLEAISGVELPKATSLCTRCPIQLRLREGDEKIEISYGQGSSLHPKKISRNDIAREISISQEHIVSSSGLEITDETISVLIQTPDGFNLTLIDLPGINRDTNDIEEQTVKIIERYIKSEQTIITVVFKCTTDVKAVKAFQLAKKFDPEGKRTIGVISHCDTLSENWEEAISKLVSSQSGVFIPVACRDYISGGTSAEENVLSQRAEPETFSSR
uniref:Dynamin-type G domain-containing protein n=1 Tax=Macrostomum lignano TaxID=282301 RepID=A0A1I8J103_9PLAT